MCSSFAGTPQLTLPVCSQLESSLSRAQQLGVRYRFVAYSSGLQLWGLIACFILMVYGYWRSYEHRRKHTKERVKRSCLLAAGAAMPPEEASTTVPLPDSPPASPSARTMGQISRQSSTLRTAVAIVDGAAEQSAAAQPPSPGNKTPWGKMASPQAADDANWLQRRINALKAWYKDYHWIPLDPPRLQTPEIRRAQRAYFNLLVLREEVQDVTRVLDTVRLHCCVEEGQVTKPRDNSATDPDAKPENAEV